MLIGLIFLSSCSTTQDKKNLSERVQAEEVRSLQEINSHAKFLLESHPELNEPTKSDLGTLLNLTIAKQQVLKDEESKIFQLLLNESLRVNQLNDEEKKQKGILASRLKVVYEEKSRNVLSLIDKIVELSAKKVLNESFERDMVDFIREVR